MPAEVKAVLLDLVGHATGPGWPARRATAALGLDHARYYHWAARRDAGRLEDAPPGGHPLHGLLAWEHAAVVGLFEAWGEIDRSHRKLAHRSRVIAKSERVGPGIPGNPRPRSHQIRRVERGSREPRRTPP